MKRQPPPNSSAQTSNVWVGLVSQAGSVQQCRAVYGGRVCIDFLPLEDKLGGVEHGIIGSTAQRSVAIASARLASMPSTASRASAADRLPLLQACSRAVHPSTSCRLVLIPSASRRARRHGSWSAFAASDHQANKSSTVCLGVFCAVAVAAIAWAAQLHAYYCPSYLRVCWNGASTSAPDCALCFASVGFLCHPIKYSCAAVVMRILDSSFPPLTWVPMRWGWLLARRGLGAKSGMVLRCDVCAACGSCVAELPPQHAVCRWIMRKQRSK